MQTGRVAHDPCGITTVIVDVPSGRGTLRARSSGEQITRVDLVDVASYQLDLHVVVSTSRGEVAVDFSYGGAIHSRTPRAAPRSTPVLRQDLSPDNRVELSGLRSFIIQ
ncbi:proline racemase family protein [Nocardia sp. NPDC049526]|uniref:proline racemase family protein n=1 Tax=Nocardia sp. NPDC049526 TaxID=3364316 RepID=UPI0037965BFC